jgi:hypothetical protein
MDASRQSPEPEEVKGGVSLTKIAIAGIVFVIVAGILYYLFGSHSERKTPAVPTANSQISPAEQEYIKNIQIENITMSRAENFLHQEVTTVSGEVYNSGNEPVSGLRLTVEFSDDMNQVVLRETRDISGVPERALAPGERRAFEISFEHVPASWNMQQPIIRVSYLQFPARK